MRSSDDNRRSKSEISFWSVRVKSSKSRGGAPLKYWFGAAFLCFVLIIINILLKLW
jgi:hypothetical protein